MYQPAREYLKTLVTADQLEKALETLSQPGFVTDTELQNQVIQLRARLTQANQARGNTATHDQAMIDRNQIRQGLLHLIDSLPESLQLRIEEAGKEKRQRLQWVTGLLAYAVIALGSLYWLQQPQKPVRAEGHIVSDQTDFVLSPSGRKIDLNSQFLSRFYLRNYRTLTLRADSVTADNDGDGRPDQTWKTDGMEVVFSADHTLGNVTAGVVSPVQINELRLSDTMVSIVRTETDGSFDLYSQSRQPEQGSFSFSDSLTLQLEYVSVAGLQGTTDWMGPVRVKAYGQAGNLTFESFPGSWVLSFGIKDSLQFKGLQLDQLTFRKKAGPGSTVSSVLGGEITVKDLLQKAPYSTHSFQGADPLYLQHRSAVESSITLLPIGIDLDFKGEFDRIVVSDMDQRPLNPTRLEWMWYAHRIRIILWAGFLAGALFFLPDATRGPILKFIEHLRKIFKG